jgi:transcriptional regulator with XRE-family HTH domain
MTDAKRGSARHFAHEHSSSEWERDVSPRANSADYGSRVTERRGRISANQFDAQQFAGRLSEGLKELGVTPGDLAKALLHSRRQVAKWTTSQNPSIPDPADLLAICRAFKISANYLLLGKGPMLIQKELESVNLTEQLAAELTTRLLALGHDEHEIAKLLVRDGDILKRLAAVYSFRLNLAPIAVILGLSAHQLEFVSQEVEVRMRTSVAEGTQPTRTSVAAAEYLRSGKKGSARGRKKLRTGR